MCIDCWGRYDSPPIDNPSVRRAAELIETIYDHSGVGVPFHVELDDWNLGFDSWEPSWGNDEPDPEHRAAAAELAPLMRGMTEEERASALGLQSGFWHHNEGAST